MVHEVDTAERAVEKILTVFDGPSVEALTRRVHVLYNLAKDHRKGEIVELGTHHGYGAFALTYGAMSSVPSNHVPIYTVDDYAEKTGWAGEHYGVEDYSIFRDKRRKLGIAGKITHLLMEAINASTMFNESEVGLLYIDTGQKEILPKIFEAWEDKVCDCGIVAFRDTLNRALGCDKIAANAVLSGKFSMIESPDEYFILLKRVA